MSTRYELVTIGGIEYRLRFTVASVQDAQKKSGKSFGGLLAALTVMDLDAYAYLAWAAFRGGGKETLTYADGQKLLQAWLDDGGATLDVVAEAIDNAAIASGFYKPAPKKEAEGEAPDPLAEAEPSMTG